MGAVQGLPANQHSQSSHNMLNWARLAVLVSWQILNGSQDFFFLFSTLSFIYFSKYETIVLYVLQFSLLIFFLPRQCSVGRLGCFYLLNYCVNILISGWCLTIRVSIQGVKLNHFDPNFSDYMVHSYLRMRILTFYPTKQVRRGFFPPMVCQIPNNIQKASGMPKKRFRDVLPFQEMETEIQLFSVFYKC